MNSGDWSWPAAASGPPLAEDEVHVWSVDLDDHGVPTEGLMQGLSSDEQERAARFATEELRRRFATGRAVLRQVLGECLGCGPLSLELRFGPKGKPELDGKYQGAVHFNLSHTGGVGLIALTRKCPVGIDVERLREMPNPQQIADRFFTRNESTQLERLSEVERSAAFFNLWTRKEAWLKANGLGIGDSLDGVEVTFLPGEPARVLHMQAEPGGAEAWTLTELAPAKGFVGALALRARGLNVRCAHRVK